MVQTEYNRADAATDHLAVAGQLPIAEVRNALEHRRILGDQVFAEADDDLAHRGVDLAVGRHLCQVGIPAGRIEYVGHGWRRVVGAVLETLLIDALRIGGPLAAPGDDKVAGVVQRDARDALIAAAGAVDGELVADFTVITQQQIDADLAVGGVALGVNTPSVAVLVLAFPDDHKVAVGVHCDLRTLLIVGDVSVHEELTRRDRFVGGIGVVRVIGIVGVVRFVRFVRFVGSAGRDEYGAIGVIPLGKDALLAAGAGAVAAAAAVLAVTGPGNHKVAVGVHGHGRPLLVAVEGVVDHKLHTGRLNDRVDPVGVGRNAGVQADGAEAHVELGSV